MTGGAPLPARGRDVRDRLEALAADPRPLARPVVVLGGWRAWRLNATSLRDRLRASTSGRPGDFEAVSFQTISSIEAAAERTIERVAARWPSGDDGLTREVDVVGISMGGLVARLAASEAGPADRLRLRIARLFTIGTPHRGSRLAARIAIDPASRSMRPGSRLLGTLEEARRSAGYEIVPYARLNDVMVGARNTAPPGMSPYWGAGPRLLSHVTITGDRRIALDIALRLRGETPIAGEASEPPMH